MARRGSITGPVAPEKRQPGETEQEALERITKEEEITGPVAPEKLLPGESQQEALDRLNIGIGTSQGAGPPPIGKLHQPPPAPAPAPPPSRRGTIPASIKFRVDPSIERATELPPGTQELRHEVIKQRENVPIGEELAGIRYEIKQDTRMINAKNKLSPYMKKGEIDIAEAVKNLGEGKTRQYLNAIGYSWAEATRLAHSPIKAEKEFKQLHMTVGDGEYIKKTDFNALTANQQRDVRAGGIAALDVSNLTAEEKFKKYQDWNLKADDRYSLRTKVFAGDDGKGNPTYRNVNAYDKEKQQIRDAVAKGKLPPGFFKDRYRAITKGGQTGYREVKVDGKTYFTTKLGPENRWREAGLMLGDMVVPFFYVSRKWNKMPDWERGVWLALDVLFVTSIAPKASGASAVRAGVVEARTAITKAVGATGAAVIKREFTVGLVKAIESGKSSKVFKFGVKIEALGTRMKANRIVGGEQLRNHGKFIKENAEAIAQGEVNLKPGSIANASRTIRHYTEFSEAIRKMPEHLKSYARRAGLSDHEILEIYGKTGDDIKSFKQMVDKVVSEKNARFGKASDESRGLEKQLEKESKLKPVALKERTAYDWSFPAVKESAAEKALRLRKEKKLRDALSKSKEAYIIKRQLTKQANIYARAAEKAIAKKALKAAIKRQLAEKLAASMKVKLSTRTKIISDTMLELGASVYTATYTRLINQGATKQQAETHALQAAKIAIQTALQEAFKVETKTIPSAKVKPVPSPVPYPIPKPSVETKTDIKPVPDTKYKTDDDVPTPVPKISIEKPKVRKTTKDEGGRRKALLIPSLRPQRGAVVKGLSTGRVAWQQGELHGKPVWITLDPQGNKTYTRKPPKDARVLKGKPKVTIQKIEGEKYPSAVKTKMGAFKVIVSESGKRISFAKGEKKKGYLLEKGRRMSRRRRGKMIH